MAQTHQAAARLGTSREIRITASGELASGPLLFLLSALFMTVIMVGASMGPTTTTRRRRSASWA